ncbi:polyketide synthase dehydratase domain-containing protein, partial [Streptomyces sp. NPDC005963]|uniref:polyketide synthase dehydratase domain-containing protein n=1 Tax=Streptomyces sp. NPDC005963 TaxID=3156721 RepID=UPI0033DEA577
LTHTNHPPTTPDHWTQHLRHTVNYHHATQTLQAEADQLLIVEVGPDAALTSLTPGAVPVLRRNRSERTTFLTALATAHVRGVPVDWEKLVPAGTNDSAGLPTYPFQRRRYWMDESSAMAAGAALLGPAVELADGRGLLFSGVLDTRRLGWLTDHAVHDTVLVPGSVFVELALRAAERADCPTVDDLTLEAPLLLTEGSDRLLVQVSLDGPTADGRRGFTIHARSTDDTPWVRHASGTLAPEEASAGPETDPSGELPAEATALDVDEVYARLGTLGYGYGPAFRNVRAAWRSGETLWAEVGLPEELKTGVEEYALHPALLDAALHLLPVRHEDAADAILPFSWTGLRLHATGATELRVRLTPAGAETYSLTCTDPTGALVATAEALILRPLAADALDAHRTVTAPPLYAVDWTPVSFPDALDATAASLTEQVTVTSAESPRAAAREALSLVQEWLTREAPDGARLAVITRGAVAAVEGDSLPDVASAPVWGLVRTAQSEHPGRFVLIDTDDTPASQQALS